MIIFSDDLCSPISKISPDPQGLAEFIHAVDLKVFQDRMHNNSSWISKGMQYCCLSISHLCVTDVERSSTSLYWFSYIFRSLKILAPIPVGYWLHLFWRKRKWRGRFKRFTRKNRTVLVGTVHTRDTCLMKTEAWFKKWVSIWNIQKGETVSHHFGGGEDNDALLWLWWLKPLDQCWVRASNRNQRQAELRSTQTQQFELLSIQTYLVGW